MQTNRDYYFVNKDIYYQFGCSFYETSAAHRQHVDDVFHTLVRDIRQTHRHMDTQTHRPTDKKKRKKKETKKHPNKQNNKQGNKERRKKEIKNVFILKIHIKQNNNKKVK